MSMRKTITAAMLALCQATFAQSGIYLTGETGYAKQSNTPDLTTIIARSQSQQHAPIGRLSLGYLHDFNDWLGFGFEIGTGWYQGTTYNFVTQKPRNISYKTATSSNFVRKKPTLARVNAHSSAMEFLTITTLHHQAWDFFAKLGGIRHTLGNFSIIHNESDNASETRIQLEVGAGINYHFNDHLALTTQYLHSFGNQTNCPSLNIGLIGLRIAFW